MNINLTELSDFAFVGDVLCGNEFKGTTHLGILQKWFGIHWWTCRAFALLIVALFIMLPLVMLRRVGISTTTTTTKSTSSYFSLTQIKTFILFNCTYTWLMKHRFFLFCFGSHDYINRFTPV